MIDLVFGWLLFATDNGGMPGLNPGQPPDSDADDYIAPSREAQLEHCNELLTELGWHPSTDESLQPAPAGECHDQVADYCKTRPVVARWVFGHLTDRSPRMLCARCIDRRRTIRQRIPDRSVKPLDEASTPGSAIAVREPEPQPHPKPPETPPR